MVPESDSDENVNKIENDYVSQSPQVIIHRFFLIERNTPFYFF